MKLKLNASVKNVLTGNDFKTVDGAVNTLRGFVVDAISHVDSGDTPEEKVRLHEIIELIMSTKEASVTVSAEDVVLIKKCVGVFYGPLAVRPLYQLLDT